MERELRAQVWCRLIGELESLMSGHRGITEASRIISALRFDLEEESNALFLPFVGIDSETDTFPLGHVRDRWQPAALAALDVRRSELEAIYRPAAFEAAEKLLVYARAHAL